MAAHTHHGRHDIVGEVPQPARHGGVGVAMVQVKDHHADKDGSGCHGHDQCQVDTYWKEREVRK